MALRDRHRRAQQGESGRARLPRLLAEETGANPTRVMLRRLLDSPRLYYGLAIVLGVVALLSQFEIRPVARPPGTADDLATLRERDDLNVIFVLVDALRADHVGPPTPVLDALASSSIRFSSR